MPRMISKDILDDPAAVFRPFAASETEVLRDFSTGTRRLADMSFFGQVPKKAVFGWDVERGETREMDEPSDEAVRAAITQFRQLYSPREPHSLNRVLNLLGRSIHERDGDRRDEALALIDLHRSNAREVMRPTIGITFERPSGSEEISTEKIIDAYVHGHYLHSGNDKSKLARELDDLQPFPRFTLYSVMLGLRNVYWVAANGVDRVLATPALLNAT